MAYKKIDHYDEDVTKGLMKNYESTLTLLGEDAQREGLQKTPERIAKAMQYITQGYQLDAHAILNSAKFHEDVSEMVIVKDIELYSMCEHHMLPFYGKAHADKRHFSSCNAGHGRQKAVGDKTLGHHGTVEIRGL